MSFSQRSKLLASAAMGALAWTAPAGATVIAHNGSTNESTPPGDGSVMVDFDCSENSDPLDVNCDKEFNDVVNHVLTFRTNDQGEGDLDEVITNETGTPWTDFHFMFELLSPPPLEDFFFEFETSGLPLGSSFQRTNDKLWLFFGNPLPNEESFFVSLEFSAEFEGGSEPLDIRITQFPSIPEPGTLGLAVAGLGGLAALRRRRKRDR